MIVSAKNFPDVTSKTFPSKTVSDNRVFTIGNGIPLDMLPVENGSFIMGSSGFAACSDETPHKVTLTKDYWIGKYEVTQEQYEAVMDVNPSFNNKGGKYPVEQVDWDDARKFCKKLNDILSSQLPTGYEFRLPTEAEWEYAARGGKKSNGYKCSGSNDIGSVAWYDDNSGNTTHPVGDKTPNELGIYDMSGNVKEWCLDYCNFNLKPYVVETDTYRNNIQDPLCTMGADRMQRGGSWNYLARCCSVSFRFGCAPSSRLFNLGFRLVLAPILKNNEEIKKDIPEKSCANPIESNYKNIEKTYYKIKQKTTRDCFTFRHSENCHVTCCNFDNSQNNSIVLGFQQAVTKGSPTDTKKNLQNLKSDQKSNNISNSTQCPIVIKGNLISAEYRIDKNDSKFDEIRKLEEEIGKGENSSSLYVTSFFVTWGIFFLTAGMGGLATGWIPGLFIALIIGSIGDSIEEKRKKEVFNNHPLHDEYMEVKNNAFRALRSCKEYWETLDGITFERKIALILKNMGYSNVKLTPPRNDHGIDITFNDKDGTFTGVQCKRYFHPVGVGAIRDFYGALTQNKITKVVFVCTGGFTSGATAFCREVGIKTLQIDDIIKMDMQSSGSYDENLVEEFLTSMKNAKILETYLKMHTQSSQTKDKY